MLRGAIERVVARLMHGARMRVTVLEPIPTADWNPANLDARVAGARALRETLAKDV